MCYLLFTDFQQNINAAGAVMQSRGHYYAERTNLCSQVFAIKKIADLQEQLDESEQCIKVLEWAKQKGTNPLFLMRKHGK